LIIRHVYKRLQECLRACTMGDVSLHVGFYLSWYISSFSLLLTCLDCYVDF
jgi:hypothetical protein